MPCPPTPRSDGTADDARPGFTLERSLTHRLHTLTKLTDRATQQAYQQEVGLALGEGRCLAAVGAFGPLSVNDLAGRANLDKAQASRAAQVLVDRGLVCKTTSPSDARAVVLTLSPAGEATWRDLSAAIARRNDEITACLNHTERALLDRLIDRLLAHARQPSPPG
ncbi:MAG: MarR family winged helix-turn-helix transcriptional regulator [Rubrivivax sp.]